MLIILLSITYNLRSLSSACSQTEGQCSAMKSKFYNKCGNNKMSVNLYSRLPSIDKHPCLAARFLLSPIIRHPNRKL